MRARAGGCTADGEAREDKEGEVGNAEGTSRAEWSSGKGGWESKGGAVAEGPPRFMPVRDVAVLEQPRANARAKDGKAVIELSRMAESGTSKKESARLVLRTSHRLSLLVYTREIAHRLRLFRWYVSTSYYRVHGHGHGTCYVVHGACYVSVVRATCYVDV